MNSIIEHANTSESEVCGFVYLDGDEIKTKPAKNFSSSPDLYEIHPLETLRMLRAGKLVAIYHSHVGDDDEEPSPFDVFNTNNCGIPFLIYSKATKKFKLVMPERVTVNKEGVAKLQATL